ncbi:type II toxin-antitoxin system RelE/ParE family toxin [Chryseobacterium luquanense]|uniref:Type II toxin-antitoxin system RelE/ParE family toxin n=1 Tax=Chryseobacterium luquanense TaxID=2983766 RepID=A0ABT3Y0V0_9FLAO|nr:type II toxin-antitoxin system RelE/ParE family toxin [Chryseobacterium luquanense]MCX8531758.1 type II toxin-antitoxin system RelE/ParE family toxin [Chryseobacterium luquanense]
MEIVWSDEVLQNYFRVLDYLFENWTVKEIKIFETKFDRLITRLKTHKQICPKSSLLNYRKCLIDKNNSLIYQEVNHVIFLVAIIDDKSSHQY